MMQLERLNEIHEYLLLSLPPLNHIRVPLSTVPLLNVLDLDDPVRVLVDLLERLLDETPPVVVHLAPDSEHELVDVERPVVVRVEHVEYERHVLVVDAHFEVLAGLRELVQGDVLAPVVVHYREELLEAHDSTDAPRLNLVSEEPDELVRVRV